MTTDGTIRIRRGDRVWVVDASAVLEVSRHRRRSPVPGAAPGVVGASSIRGIVVPIFDLDVRLGYGAPDPSRHLTVFIGGAEPLFGIVADTCELVGTLADSSPASASSHPVGPWADDPLVRTVWPDGTLAIDTNALLTDPRLQAGPTERDADGARRV